MHGVCAGQCQRNPLEGLFVAGGEGALERRGAGGCHRGAVPQVALGRGLVGAVTLGQEDRYGDRSDDSHNDHDRDDKSGLLRLSVSEPGTDL